MEFFKAYSNTTVSFLFFLNARFSIGEHGGDF